MAKLKAPLLSLGASGALGKTLVFFPWKGIDAVREYVVPANPQSDDQTIQRNFLKYCVAAIHAAIANATTPMTADDIAAMRLWASLSPTPLTWFNQICKNWLNVYVAGFDAAVYRQGGNQAPGATTCVVAVRFTKKSGEGDPGDVYIKYGTKKTALINSSAAVSVTDTDLYTDTLTGLITGTKYYWQIQVKEAEAGEGGKSGIYTFTTA